MFQCLCYIKSFQCFPIKMNKLYIQVYRIVFYRNVDARYLSCITLTIPWLYSCISLLFSVKRQNWGCVEYEWARQYTHISHLVFRFSKTCKQKFISQKAACWLQLRKTQTIESKLCLCLSSCFCDVTSEHPADNAHREIRSTRL